MQRDQLYWDDVSTRDELPGYEIEITARRLYLQASGSQDWYPVHFDPTFARKAGHEDVFMNTGFVQAVLVRLISAWMGDAGFLKRLKVEMRRQHRPGDTMSVRGKVLRKQVRDGEGCIDLEVWTENEREGIATPAEATVVLPRRS